MKLFQRNQIDEALEYASRGKQSLHIYPSLKRMNAPKMFMRYSTWGHLLDQQPGRLRKTAKRLGVKIVKIHKPGTKSQHVDLCGRPLDRAIKLCEDSNDEKG